MMPVRLYVCPSVTEVHWLIISNLGFKFRSHFTAHCGRRAASGRRAARRGACGRIISRHASQPVLDSLDFFRRKRLDFSELRGWPADVCTL